MIRHSFRINERGLSVPELMASMFLMSVVSLVFYQLFIGTMRVNMFLESHNDLATIGQRAVNTVKADVLQARTLFQENALGVGYRAALDSGDLAAHPTMAGSLLPVIDPNGSLVPDQPGFRRIGNSLLMTRENLPKSYMVDHDRDVTTPQVEYLIDVFNFNFIYQSRNTSRQFDELDYYVDLIRAESDPYADYNRLNSLDLTVRRVICRKLVTDGIRYAWASGQTADQAFYRIETTGALSGPESHAIKLPRLESLLPEFRGGRVAGNMDYSVGIQLDPPLTTQHPVSQYAQLNPPFPGGFEALIIGPASSRRVLTRLMLLSKAGNNLTSQVNTVTGVTSEF